MNTVSTIHISAIHICAASARSHSRPTWQIEIDDRARNRYKSILFWLEAAVHNFHMQELAAVLPLTNDPSVGGGSNLPTQKKAFSSQKAYGAAVPDPAHFFMFRIFLSWD